MRIGQVFTGYRGGNAGEYCLEACQERCEELVAILWIQLKIRGTDRRAQKQQLMIPIVRDFKLVLTSRIGGLGCCRFS